MAAPLVLELVHFNSQATALFLKRRIRGKVIRLLWLLLMEDAVHCFKRFFFFEADHAQDGPGIWGRGPKKTNQVEPLWHLPGSQRR